MIERRNAPSLSPPPDYSHVAVAPSGRLAITAGAVPLGANGVRVGSGDYVAQTRQTVANLERPLAAVDATGEAVLKTTVYVVAKDRTDLSTVWRVVQESSFAAAASTLLGVSLLGYEGQLVEIEAIAVLP